ncbi:MAG: cation transporter [Deltaproteobacteria bacterium]|nr:cation transporter [Deltaproteobacteria bacterium]
MTVLGLWGNILLSIIKFIIGFLGHSQAVVADATHSLSDTSTYFELIFLPICGR